MRESPEHFNFLKNHLNIAVCNEILSLKYFKLSRKSKVLTCFHEYKCSRKSSKCYGPQAFLRNIPFVGLIDIRKNLCKNLSFSPKTFVLFVIDFRENTKKEKLLLEFV